MASAEDGKQYNNKVRPTCYPIRISSTESLQPSRDMLFLPYLVKQIVRKVYAGLALAWGVPYWCAIFVRPSHRRCSVERPRRVRGARCWMVMSKDFPSVVLFYFAVRTYVEKKIGHAQCWFPLMALTAAVESPAEHEGLCC